MSEYSWITDITQAGPKQSTIQIKVNPQYASTITQRLQPYKNLPDKFRPALEGVADYLAKVAIPRTFSQEGPGWRKLSKRTQRERVAQGYGAEHPILVRTGDLFQEVSNRSHPKHIEVIKVGKNARLIFGGSSTKFIRNQAGDTTLNIPSRPMIPGTNGLPVTDEQAQAMKQIITDKIHQAMAKR